MQAPPSLVGIVSAQPGENAGRTAVFAAADGTPEFGRLDELIGAGRYRVRAVEADNVTVVDTITGEASCLRLR